MATAELVGPTTAVVNPQRPDGSTGFGEETWRNVLVRYNERHHREGANPNRLLTAADLYAPRVYRCLVEAFGSTNVYILSAGWGLVRSDFLLPDYDITFSNQPKVPRYARRGCRDSSAWKDFNHLRAAELSPNEPVHFFGGQDYLTLYYRLTDGLSARKVIHHKVTMPHLPGYEYRLHTGKGNTNWHYRAAEEFIRNQSGANE